MSNDTDYIEHTIAGVLILGIVFVEDIDLFSKAVFRTITSLVLLTNTIILSCESPALSILCMILFIQIHVRYTLPDVWP
jgi:hypothetical protein